MLTKDLKQQFCGLASDLSPENLTCDGELSPARVKAKKARILKEWGRLERLAGRTVSETEANSWYDF